MDEDTLCSSDILQCLAYVFKCCACLQQLCVNVAPEGCNKGDEATDTILNNEIVPNDFARSEIIADLEENGDKKI
ncbi:hypothetical protein CHS0354_009943 [Potamilus streckersoni]|uniref:Uncharacterized protein n=1 Tax=Potamilus streckersoni TaxID=2493646 RepID=A0AAE0TCT9_9BIVA|nr:hypothetical protein CHS0354_009943 [Potamilus streckersoni]